MRKLVHVLMLMFMASTCHAEITKADILKTLDHMRRLQQEQRNELDKANWDYTQQGIALKTKTDEALKWQSDAHENAKERDVLVYLFSLIFGCWLLSRYQDFQIPIDPPWKWLIELGFFAAGFGAAYAAGRYLLMWSAHFIP